VIDAFVLGSNSHIYETWYNWGNGQWGGWIDMSGSVSSDQQAVATSDGHDQVFGTGSNLLQESWFSPSDGTFGGWVTPGSVGTPEIGSPALVPRSGQSVVDAFVRGGNNQIYEMWYNFGTGGWGGWIGIGGGPKSVTSDPQAQATSDGHDQVFGTGGGYAEQTWFNPPDGTMGGWISF
jgi:hypothetical protein